MPRKPKISKERLIELQVELKTDAKIGAVFGISRQAVHQARKKFNLSTIEKNEIRDKEIISLYKEGKKVDNIAQKFHLSVSQTYRIIKLKKK